MPQSLFSGTMANVANQRISAIGAFTPPPTVTITRPWFSISNPGGLNGYEDTQDNVVGHDFDAVRLFHGSFVADPRPLLQPYIGMGRAVVYSTKPPTSNVAANYATLAANLESLGGQIYATVNHEPENDTAPDQFALNYTTFFNAMQDVPNVQVGPIYMLGTLTSNGSQAAYRPFIDTMPLDWLGVDGYNPLNRRSFQQMFNVWALKARSRNVPWIIAEWSTHGTPTERAAHVRQGRTYWENPANSDLLIVSWFDSDGGPRAGPSGWRMDRALPDGWVVVDNIAQAASPPPEYVADVETPSAIFDALQTLRRNLGPGTQPPPPPVPLQRGAVDIGEADYTIPAGAVYVAPGGSDGAGGAIGTPKATILAAATAAPNNGAVVLREGTYYQSTFLPAGKNLTIQNYPGEAVWLCGSDVVTGWIQDNTGPGGTNRWRRANSNPGFNRVPSAGEVDPSFPEAPWPDQVWIDGVALEQVDNLADVGTTVTEPGAPGTFWLDTVTNRMWIGTTPFNKTVELATRQVAIGTSQSPVQAPPKIVIRGIGIKHFATSPNQKGAVQIHGDDSLIENCHIVHNSAAGVFINAAASCKLRLTTMENNGQLGYRAFRSPYLLVEQNRVVRNNRKRFATYGAAGGGKADTDCIGALVRNNYGEKNWGHCFWIDLYSHYSSFIGNEVYDHAYGAGLFFEMSVRSVIAGNWVKGCIHGVLVSEAGVADVWNNTIIDCTNPLIFQMGARADDRQFTARNNVISQRINFSPQTVYTGIDTIGDGRDWIEQQWTVDGNAVWMRYAQNYAKLSIPGNTRATYADQAALLAATAGIDEASITTSGGSVDPYLGSDDKTPKVPVQGTGIEVPQEVKNLLTDAGVWTSSRAALPPNIGAY